MSRRVGVSAFVLAAALLAVNSSSTPAQIAKGTIGGAISGSPNVIFITVDDADLSLMRFLPKTQALIAAQGATFTNYYDSLALCCSARTTYLRGQYVHNTGIWSNSWPDGGFGKFHAEGGEDSTVATWISSTGYRTGLMGKYLNQYPDVPQDPTKGVAESFVPPGWSDWAVPVHGTAYKEFHYKLNVNGAVDAAPRGRDDPTNYMVDTISSMADGYVIDHASEPYFLYLAPYAPHSPFVPAPRYARDYPGMKYPKNPSFNEADVSDKPPSIADIPLLSASYIKTINGDYRDRARDMEAVDDLVVNLYAALEQTGQLDRTYLVFTSDNGLHMGEHRQVEGKLAPYEEDIHLPLWICGPGIAAGTTIDDMVSDVDLAPTFAELTGAVIPDFVDGHSLVPLLAGAHPADWRTYFLLERETVAAGGGSPDVQHIRGGLQEPLDSQPALPNLPAPTLPAYVGLHSNRYVYVDYYEGSGVNKEFYDLQSDPYELQNLLGPGSPGLTGEQDAALSDMQTALETERSCSPTTSPCR